MAFFFHRIHLLVAALTTLAMTTPVFSQEPKVEQPETVLVTLYAKSGAEDALARLIGRHWEVSRRLGLVRADAPHITLRGRDRSGHSYFVDIFTWSDGSIPDAAPSEIRTIWQEMNELVEARAGHRGLEIKEMVMVP